MADENLENTEPQGAQGEGATSAGPAPAGTEPQGDAGGEGGSGGGDVLDKHGEPGIAKGKYQRDIAERDKRIKELEGQIAEAAKSEERAEGLKSEFEAAKAKWADDELTYKLEALGCIDSKAAKARLADYDGDAAKLKAACPYLFAEENKGGKTGLRPAGSPKDTKSAIDKAMGFGK